VGERTPAPKKLSGAGGSDLGGHEPPNFSRRPRISRMRRPAAPEGAGNCAMFKAMDNESRVRAAEAEFFSALLSADVAALDDLLADDFTLIGLNGALITKPDLRGAIAAGILVFERIDPVSADVRFYQHMAVVTGQTSMAGQFSGTAFTADSRYTHVFDGQNARCRLVAAQGTPIV